MTSRIRVGRTIRIARNDAGLSQADLAARIRQRGAPLDKTHPQTISDIERDVQFPGPELLAAICDVLGIHSLPLLSGSGLTPQAPPAVDSPSVPPTQADPERQSADVSAAAAPLTYPDLSIEQDVLTEDEKAMLTPSEQHVIRQMRRASQSDQEQIVRVVDAITGHAEERAKGSTGTFDSQPTRFRR